MIKECQHKINTGSEIQVQNITMLRSLLGSNKKELENMIIQNYPIG